MTLTMKVFQILNQNAKVEKHSLEITEPETLLELH